MRAGPDPLAEHAAALEPTLRQLRAALHRQPELSGQEAQTATLLEELLQRQAPPISLERGLGGNGLAASYSGAAPGATVLVRCELDALPLPEGIALAHGSRVAGVAHKCGHDGHMAIVAGLAQLLTRQPLVQGQAVLLFQPAEETGQGARQVLAEPRFATLAPDLVLALHNLPGYPLGQVVLRAGPFAAASTGVIIELEGSTAHAAEPQRGRSPALALAQLIGQLSALPQQHSALHEAAQATIICARLGEQAFGTSPGQAVLMATLRAHRDSVLETLLQRCRDYAQAIAKAHGLRVQLRQTESFPATSNSSRVCQVIAEEAQGLGLTVHWAPSPFAWSEDFGHFTAAHQGALFGLGAGEELPPLHSPGYDFPDALLLPGAQLLYRLVARLCAAPPERSGP